MRERGSRNERSEVEEKRVRTSATFESCLPMYLRFPKGVETNGLGSMSQTDAVFLQCVSAGFGVIGVVRKKRVILS